MTDPRHRGRRQDRPARRLARSTPTITRWSSTRRDADHLLVGNDGGLYEILRPRRAPGGTSTTSRSPSSTGCRVDNALPFYNIYGGTQDNGSLGVPVAHRQSRRHPHQRLDEHRRRRRLPVARRLADPDTVYSCSQQIDCVAARPADRPERHIRPRSASEDARLRSRWDIPFIISPHNHTRLYIAANRLIRSDDRGDTWKWSVPT